MNDHKTIDGYPVEDERYDESDLQTPDEWVNLGDMNPEDHGGHFIKWKGDMWHVVITTHEDVLPEGMMEGKSQMVEDLFLEPMDVWVNGNPSEGFTDAALWDINGLNSMSQPETTWDIDGLLSTIAVGLPAYAHYNRRTYYVDEDEDYWEYLAEQYDIPNPDESDKVGRR